MAAVDVTGDVSEVRERFDLVRAEVGKVLVGQDQLVTRLLLALLADGHALLEGVPGLAKTLAVGTLADAVDCGFSRIQFTPDMLPGDVTGTQIFNPKDGTYSVKKGPVFGNLVLADEINRAPAKVQAALLEAMQERQVTLGEQTFPLDAPFMVLATQNPIEQEGTYPLPEAQLDRFMMKPRHRLSERRRRGAHHRPDGGVGARAEGLARHDGRGHPGGEEGGAADLRRRQGQALCGGPGRRHPRSGGRRHLRVDGSDRIRCFRAWFAQPGSRGKGERFAGRTRLHQSP